MSDFMSDLSSYTQNVVEKSYKVNGMNIKVQNKSDNMKLDMTDFLQLMITQLTNQGIDETMDTSEMLNQMVQMQMITAMTNMTDASIMSYGASLVGKEVTVAKIDGNGKMQEYVGTVSGTGTMNGKQVIVIDDEYYYLNEILAVGRLPDPPKTEDTEKPGEGEDTVTKPEDTEKPGEGEGTITKPEDTEKPGEGEGTVTKPEDAEKPGEGENTVTKPEDTKEPDPVSPPTETPLYTGMDGVPGTSDD